jgi:hypothetical protein
VARKGEQNDHHFAHHGSADGLGCSTGAETALHRFAKECLARRLELVLPAWDAPSTSEHQLGYPGGSLRFDAALLECRLDRIVPDVILRRGGRDLIVEFRVTHPCAADKIAKIIAMKVAAIEIDLSWLPRDLTRIGMEEAILTVAPRRWLHNPRLRSQPPTPEHPSVTKPSRVTTVASLARAYQTACSEARTVRPTSLSAARIADLGLAHAIGIDVPGIGCFAVPPSDWQAVILEQVLDQALGGGRPVFTPADALRRLRQRGWTHSRFLRLTAPEAAALRESVPSFARPAEAILAWAAAVARSGVFVPAGGANRWVLWLGVIATVCGVRRSRPATPT